MSHVALVLLVATQSKPDALRAMEEARRTVVSGRIVWSKVDDQRLPEREFTFISRYATNGDYIIEERGDQDGWVTWNQIEKKPLRRYPILRMINTDGVWMARETQPVVDLWKPQAEVPPEQCNDPPRTEDMKDVFAGLEYFQRRWRRFEWAPIACGSFARMTATPRCAGRRIAWVANTECSASLLTAQRSPGSLIPTRAGMQRD